MNAMRSPERQPGSARSKTAPQHPRAALRVNSVAAPLDSAFAIRGRETVRSKAQSVASAIRSYVEEGIATGALPPGMRLPTEIELMASFRAGRNTIRKAMRALQTEGKIVRQVGSGTFVAEPGLPARRARIVAAG